MGLCPQVQVTVFKKFQVSLEECRNHPCCPAGNSGLLSLCGFKPATAIILLMECLFLIGYYVKVLYEDFWNVVLEESKGLFADIIIWVYYFAVCAVSLVPSAVFFMILENHL